MKLTIILALAGVLLFILGFLIGHDIGFKQSVKVFMIEFEKKYPLKNGKPILKLIRNDKK